MATKSPRTELYQPGNPGRGLTRVSRSLPAVIDRVAAEGALSPAQAAGLRGLARPDWAEGSMSTGPPIGEQAAAYAARGWRVLPCWWPAPGRPCACPAPCGSPAKHPHGGLAPHGLTDATCDPDVVTLWWRTAPQANVAVRTGVVSGLVVLDVDGPAGEASLRRLLETHGQAGHLRSTWARTGSGGWHAYFAHPGRPIANSAGRLGPGLDVRGDGGYVLAPPSLHASGRRYEWVTESLGPVPQMPNWLLVQLVPREQPEVTSRPVSLFAPRLLNSSGRGVAPYVIAAVEGEAREVASVPEGQRNQRLNRAAYSLGGLVAAGAVSEVTVMEVLAVAARTAGLPEREAEATIRSGLRAGEQHPRESR